MIDPDRTSDAAKKALARQLASTLEESEPAGELLGEFVELILEENYGGETLREQIENALLTAGTDEEESIFDDSASLSIEDGEIHFDGHPLDDYFPGEDYYLPFGFRQPDFTESGPYEVGRTRTVRCTGDELPENEAGPGFHVTDGRRAATDDDTQVARENAGFDPAGYRNFLDSIFDDDREDVDLTSQSPVRLVFDDEDEQVRVHGGLKLMTRPVKIRHYADRLRSDDAECCEEPVEGCQDNEDCEQKELAEKLDSDVLADELASRMQRTERSIRPPAPK